MKYPTSVTICGYIYQIEYVETPLEVDDDFAPGHWLGQCCGNTIRVLATQEPFGILDTLIHEILHAVFNKHPMLKQALQSADTEEPFINTLAMELANLLTQNGWATTKKQPTITHRISQEA